MEPQRGPAFAPTLGAGGAKSQGLGVVKADVKGQGLVWGAAFSLEKLDWGPGGHTPLPSRVVTDLLPSLPS